MSESKNILIFGGSGFLGSYVSEELCNRGYSVLVADISKPSFEYKGQNYLKCDILNKEQVDKIVSEDFSYIYNFAALADIDEAKDAPVQTMEINVMGNLNILESCRKHNIKRLIYASSAYAFSKKGSFYGISKHMSEKLVEEYYAKYGVEYTIIRYGSLYGEYADEHNYIYSLLKKAITEKKIELPGDGSEMREYIHARDAAKLSADIIENDAFKNETLVLTGLERFNRIELFTMIKEILNDDVEIVHTDKNMTGHYKVTPYSFHPSIAKKLIANPYIDMGQGLVECLRIIQEKLDSKK